MESLHSLIMLPSNTHSSIALGGFYLPPDDKLTSPIVDYESGGMALLDASAGLFARAWKLWVQDINVWLQPEGGDSILLFTEVGIQEVSLAFDQNMQWSVAYTVNGIMKLRWYDPLESDHVITVFGAALNPRLALDDKRHAERTTSDIILAYINGSNLCYRQQRDRYETERVLRENLYPGTKLKNIGMNKNLRLQFELV